MKIRGKSFLIAALLLACILFPFQREVTAKTYYHVTLKAFLDTHDVSAVEWAWVTLVAIPKSEAYPEEAALAESYGGSLRGSVLAFVRAAAWRSDHSYAIEKRCKGRTSEMKISWNESWNDNVYATGGLDNPNNPDELHFGFTTRPIFLQNKRWFDPMSRSYAALGPVRLEGEAAEEIRGNFILRPVNYRDALKHYNFCGKQWVEQYRSEFNHFHLHEAFYDGDNEIFNQTIGKKHIVYQVLRTSSRIHPNWKQQRM
ncbi:MAG: hypothetical protein OQK67_01530 [Chlorobium sp.]|nr:hypothetical protein [Chlorobium sp.]MCW8815953.1 hypothetical protein [Chlorobium sp.]MCW8819855.1 hypothetical protein [Ignavibacteriaceae bacterium]